MKYSKNIKCQNFTYTDMKNPNCPSAERKFVQIVRNNLGTIKAQACHELQTDDTLVTSFRSQWTERLPSKKEASASNSTPSCSTKAFTADHIDKEKPSDGKLYGHME